VLVEQEDVMTPALSSLLQRLWTMPALKKLLPASVTSASIDDPLAQVVEWLEPWYRADDATTRAFFEREFTRELCPEHGLFGQRARMLARREDMDDALFSLADGRVAEVHLT